MTAWDRRCDECPHFHSDHRDGSRCDRCDCPEYTRLDAALTTDDLRV